MEQECTHLPEKLTSCQWKDNIAVWHAYTSNCFWQHYADNVSNTCRIYILVQCIEMYQPKNEVLKYLVLASLWFHF